MCIQETCQSGLLCLFAKEVGPLNGPGGSNPPVSAWRIIQTKRLRMFDRR